MSPVASLLMSLALPGAMLTAQCASLPVCGSAASGNPYPSFVQLDDFIGPVGTLMCNNAPSMSNAVTGQEWCVGMFEAAPPPAGVLDFYVVSLAPICAGLPTQYGTAYIDPNLQLAWFLRPTGVFAATATSLLTSYWNFAVPTQLWVCGLPLNVQVARWNPNTGSIVLSQNAVLARIGL